LLGHEALAGKVPHLFVVVGRKATGGILLWWPDCRLLRQWSRSKVKLLLLLLLWLLLLKLSLLVLWVIDPILLLLWSAQLSPRWGIYHAVLGRCTARTTTDRGSRHHSLPLLPISLSNGLHQPLLVNGCTSQFVVRQAGEPTHALLPVDCQPFMVQVFFLVICINII
jgi:hypothetical protein